MERHIKWNEKREQLPGVWLNECTLHLQQGGIAILPTETGYMMAVNGLNEDALDLLYETKGRPSGRATHLAVPSLEVAESLAFLGQRGRAWLTHLSPGPLSVISKGRELVPRQILGPGETIGVRIPDQRGTLEVLHAIGFPLTATSANYAGLPHELELQLILLQFPEEVRSQWFILEHDDKKYSIPSTMVLEEEETFRILREGPISELQLLDAL